VVPGQVLQGLAQGDSYPFSLVCVLLCN
jgi:hypothetical protein